jgi:hypothetical protein
MKSKVCGRRWAEHKEHLSSRDLTLLTHTMPVLKEVGYAENSGEMLLAEHHSVNMIKSKCAICYFINQHISFIY